MSRRHPTVVAAAVWLAVIVIAVLAAGWLSPHGPHEQDLLDRLSPPSLEHLMGTDRLGRDILSRILHGGQVSLLGAAVGTATAMIVGVPAGLIAGYFGRTTDRLASMIFDLLMAVPLLLVLLLAFAIFPNRTLVIMLIFGLFTAAPVFRILRGATLTVAGELYVVAARASGLTDAAILRRHVAPRLWGIITVQASIVAALALTIQVGLGFLGLDVAPPDPSWGGIVADGTQTLLLTAWPVIPPMVVICATVLALGVLGDIGRTRSDARSRSLLAPRRAAGLPATARRLATGESAPRSNPSADEPLLRVQGLTITAVLAGRPVALVEDLDLEIQRGEVVGLVGESGAGKSVSARAILQLDAGVDLRGSVRFRGAELVGAGSGALLRTRGRRVAFVGQDPMSSLDPLFRVGSQLAEAVRTHHGWSRARSMARAVELLEAVRIPDPRLVARKYPFEISGGMAQRVAIALALGGDPELLIADEPTTALDVTTQMELLGLLSWLRAERGLAILMVTHDWGVVADICDRAVSMYGGEIVETGSVADLIAKPRHPYTYQLRRSDPHAQIPGHPLRTIPGTIPVPGAFGTGCRFADRCEIAVEACRRSHPPLVAAGRGRTSRCLRIDHLRRLVQDG